MKLNDKLMDIKIIEVKGIFNRFKGFMFVRKKISNGLLFKKCKAIHTFFMFQPIDVIMTDINNNILYTYKNLKPYRIILPKKNVYYTYELPIGSISKIKE